MSCSTAWLRCRASSVYGSLHRTPATFSDEQIHAFRDLPQLCPHMHLPVQSGSTRVLQHMRRGYTRERSTWRSSQRLHDVAPDVALTTDIIVGFPGETARRL